MEVNRLKRLYEEYRNIRLLIESFTKQINKIKIVDDIDKKILILEALEYAKENLDEAKYTRVIKYYLSNNPNLRKVFDLTDSIEIGEEEIEEIYKSVPISEVAQYVILNQDNKKYLVDLISLEIVELTLQSQDFVNFVIKGLETADNFIGNITVDDLPLLMVLKEQFDAKYEVPFMNERKMENIIKRQKDSNLIIKREFEKAHNLDTAIKKDRPLKKYGVNYILKCDRIKEEWDKFDIEEKELSYDERWTKYYKLLILFANNIEKVYKEAENEKKKDCVIRAYMELTQGDECEKMPRTASALINCEVLKKEYRKNKSR